MLLCFGVKFWSDRAITVKDKFLTLIFKMSNKKYYAPYYLFIGFDSRKIF